MEGFEGMTVNSRDVGGGEGNRTSWKGPDWLGPGYAFIGAWEPLVFRRRRGGLRTDEAERYLRERSDASIADIQSVDARLVVIPWDKGFGASAQEYDREHSRSWSRALHAAGLKVGAYIRYDNVVPETMSFDEPGLDDWVARTGDGYPAAILHQSYRVAAKPTHEAHIAHVERQIVAAIDELDADLIHLDGFWMQNLAWADVSDETLAAFRRFLAERYPDEASAVERFGHVRLSTIVPPTFRETDMTLRSLTRATDPVLQEWLVFRASLTEHLAERFAALVAEHGRARGKQIAFTANTLIPIGYSNGLYWGFEVDRQGPYLDGQWTEDDHWAELRSDGVLISRIREFKIGATCGTRVFSYQRATTERQLRVSIAQSLAFNDGVVGMLGSPLVREERFYEVKREAMRWIREHLEPLTGNESAADVAVWRSSRTLMFEAAQAHRAVILAEQMLIQGAVAFDIVYDDVFAHLDRYRVLVLPDSACMSDEQIEAVRHFVHGGGVIVATDRASMYDEWYRQRPEPGLGELFGPDVIFDEGDAWQPPSAQVAGGAPIARHEVGAGGAIYLPTIQTPRPPDYRGTLGEEPYRFPTEEWQIPSNQTDFLAAIEGALGDAATVRADAPQGVAIDVQRAADGALVVHLVDYDLDREGAASVTLSVRAPAGTRATAYRFGVPPAALTPRDDADRVVLDVDVSVYAGVVFA